MELNTLVKVRKHPPSYESVAVTSSTVSVLFGRCFGCFFGFFDASDVFAHVPEHTIFICLTTNRFLACLRLIGYF
jgi:hypothetical protein